jgi:calcineurin-like phosphoesterase family protein
MIYFTSDCHFYCSNILKYQPERYKFGNNLKIINKNLINR